MNHSAVPGEKLPWWYGKIACQIYLKSFQDSNGDGIGDIRGVISRLDYLKSLGVDILWISPCYPSPWVDQGYDISDYYDIDPRYGTLAEMDELIGEAARRGMHILMDLVANHCSDQHPWFRKACSDPEGPYGKYFYIERKDPSGKLPCNWRSVFGGPAWDPLPGQPDWVYLHTFHRKQPDLNWENPEVRRSVYHNCLWWLDRGIAGFRIDAITYIKKDLPFTDAPADREDGLCYIGRSPESVKGLGVFLRELRDTVFAPRKALTIGEVFNEQRDELEKMIGPDGYFSSMFDFSHIAFGQGRQGWHSWKQITTEDYKQCVIEAQGRIGTIGCFSNVLENHDRPRAASRYLPPEGRNEAGKKCLALAYFMLRGIPFIYQGQEIGMENLTFRSPEEFVDISAIDEYQVSLNAGIGEAGALRIAGSFSRDNARTPMQWSDGENAGFTTGTPWMRMHPEYRHVNVKEQEERPDSLLNFYRAMAALRKSPEYFSTFAAGEFSPAFEERKGLLAYCRRGERNLLILANLKSEEETIPLPDSRKILLNNLSTCRIEQSRIILAGWQGIVLEVT